MDPFIRKVHDRPINGRYALVKKIGAGGFGAVYLAKDVVSGSEVALKLEYHSIDPSVLHDEAEKYEAFRGMAGFPQVYWYGQHDYFRVLALELLGPSLEDLFEYCGGQLSLKTTLSILDQSLTRLEESHARNVVHRDIKPRNFLSGTGRKGNEIYSTDFGLVHEYAVRHCSVESETKLQSRLVGTARFASIRGHQDQAQFPSDDLESLGYMMVYLLKGRLPWQGLNVDGRKNKQRAVMERKMSTTTKELCAGLPVEFERFFEAVKKLKGGHLPDYEALRAGFRASAEREGYEYDGVFDWTIRAYMERAESKS